MPDLTRNQEQTKQNDYDSAYLEFGESLMPELSDDEYARYLLSFAIYDV